MKKTATKYPILLVHGMGFRDNKIFNYWGRIPEVLEEKGYTVYYGRQEGNATVEVNGKILKERIEDILKYGTYNKVNVIAHSKGGLDIRYAISTLGIGNKIASVTTISTPHNGSKTVDFLLNFPDFLVRFVAKIADLWLRILGDKKPNSYQVFHSLTTIAAKRFNEENLDDKDVYYQSYAFVMNNAVSDIIFFVPYLVVKAIEGKNDGLLTPEATRWANYRGVYKGNSNRGISHWDEVDLRRKSLSNKTGEGISDIVDFYIDVVEELKEKGF